MTAEISTIYLLDVASGGAVTAELRAAIEERQLDDWQNIWVPALITILAELNRQGAPQSQWPQSWHWNWRAKTDEVRKLLAFKGASIVCNGMTQGLMRVDLNKAARIPVQKGKPLVYVDYLEAAPWNRPELGKTPRYRGVGTALIASAVALSIQEGFKGRVGLHSLPQADRFYKSTCQLTDLGPDSKYQNLRYFEMTPEQARAFLKEEDTL